MDYKGEKPGGLLYFMDEREGRVTFQQPLPDVDPSRIGDGAEQTHQGQA